MLAKFAFAFHFFAVLIAGCLSPGATATALPTTTFLSPGTFTPSPLPPTPTLTPTPDPRADWNGEWAIYIAGNAGEWGGTAIIQTEGDRISGEFSIYDAQDGTLQYQFSGALGSGGTVASGGWELWKPRQGGSGFFKLQLVPEDHDQFRGNMNGQYALCGWRGEAKAPNPCWG